MKKKILLIFGVILILTGCGDNQAYIKNKVLNEFKKNNIYSYFNAEGLKMIQEAGFSKYMQNTFIGSTRITLDLNLSNKNGVFTISSDEFTEYVRANNVQSCTIDRTATICETTVSIQDNSIVLPSDENNIISYYFYTYPQFINDFQINEQYITLLSAPKFNKISSHPWSDKKYNFTEYSIEYQQLPTDDINKNYLTSLGLNNISCLTLSYSTHTNDIHNGERFSVMFSPPTKEYDYTKNHGKALIELYKGEYYE